MAVDEALYLSAQRSGRTTVRLYAFARPSVSLGYRQKLNEAVDEPACRHHGVSIVRRVTGGYALLHQHELTWSVSAPTRRGPFRNASVRETYRRINGVLMEACARLGVALDRESPDARSASARTAARPRTGGVVLPCLAAPSVHEIRVDGRKLIPSAQRRHRDALLQHGSILFEVDTALWDRIRPKNSPPGLSAASLSECLPTPPRREDVVRSLTESFARFFGAEPTQTALEPDERRLAKALERKYDSERHRSTLAPY